MIKKDYSIDQLTELLISRIKNNYTHKYYNKTVELKKRLLSLRTGDGQDDILLRYRAEEAKDEVKKEQRIKVYSSRTQYASGKIMGVFSEAKRVDNAADNLRYNSTTPSIIDNIEKIERKRGDFFKGKSLKKYLDEAYHRLNFYDPNAFIVTEFMEYNGEQWAFPAEYGADEVIDYEYVNGELQYLITKTVIDIEVNRSNSHVNQMTKVEKDIVYEYRLYSHDFAIVIESLPEKTLGYKSQSEERGYSFDTLQITDGKNKGTYLLTQFVTNFDEVPANRVGYIYDPHTGFNTCLPPDHNANKIYDDLVNSKSEYDLAMALHGFLQKYQYVERCSYQSDTPKDRCVDGRMQISDEKCPSCHGTGKVMHKSVQDIIEIVMPGHPEEKILNLSEMVHYVQIPTHIIDKHQEDVDRYQKEALQAVFNSHIFDKNETTQTAYEKKIELNSVNNVLSEYVENYEHIYERITYIIAKNDGISDGLVISYRHSNDWQLETIDMLIDRRKSLIDANGSIEMINKVDEALIKKLYADDDLMVHRMETKNKFLPFADKSENERIFILSSLTDKDPNKVLWSYFSIIMSEIENKHRGFYAMNYNRQRELIYEEVDAIIDAMPEQQVIQPFVRDTEFEDVIDE